VSTHLNVVSVNLDNRGGTIVVQGPNTESVVSQQAREMVLKVAGSQGLMRAGLSSTPSAYPVDAQGDTNDAVMFGKVPVAAYRCEYKIASGL
jgi:hypothetical protein